MFKWNKKSVMSIEERQKIAIEYVKSLSGDEVKKFLKIVELEVKSDYLKNELLGNLVNDLEGDWIKEERISYEN